MSAKFFASIRRNQKQWMVVLTVLSMISFLFFDFIGGRRGHMTPFGAGLIVGCLFAAGMSIIGYPRGLTTELGSAGFLVGFLAGFLGFGALGANAPLVSTSAGNFNRADLEKFRIERLKLNQFFFAVAKKTNNPNEQGVGQLDDGSILAFRLHLADAKKMGVQISDSRVNDLLKQKFQNGLDTKDLKACLREAQLSESELFESLKDEMAAQLVSQLQYPPAVSTSIPPEFRQLMQNQGPQRFIQQTPFQLWTEYQKLTLKQSLQAVALRVRDFVDKVGEPSESELVTFFKNFANRRWVDEAQPGFTKMPAVELAYLTGDFEKFEKGSEPSDTDVAEYYQKHKDRYRKLPEKIPALDTSSKSIPSAPDQSQKTDGSPEQKDGATQQPKDEVKPEDATKKPNPDANKEPEPGDKKSSDDPKSSCGGDDKPASDAAADPTAVKSADSKKDQEQPGADPVEALAPADGDATTGKADQATSQEPQYRDLDTDEDLKLEIREHLMRDRAFERMRSELDKAFEFMRRLGVDYDIVTDKEKKAEKAKEIAKQLQDYAAAHNLIYKETGEVTFEDLVKEPIGGAVEGKRRSSVMNDVFMLTPNGDPAMPLYLPHRADSAASNEAFAYWKIAEFPASVQDFKDEEVRANVVKAWKFDRARPIAEKRAHELVAKIKSEGNNLPLAVGTETVTGDKDSPMLKIIPTDAFTWLATNRSVPGASREPTVSAIPLIDDVGDAFMKVVFEDLGDGEVGVAADDPKVVFYVVKVMNRDTGKDDEGGVVKHEREQEFMKEEFMPRFWFSTTPYQSLARMPQQQIDFAYERNFAQQHQIQWSEEARTARPTRRSR